MAKVGNLDSGIYKIPEIKISFTKKLLVDSPGPVRRTSDAAEIMRIIFDPDEIELREHGLALYLNRANEPLGYFKVAVGGVNSAVIDGKLIFAGAVRCLASGIILCHNHPSGSLKPSDADLTLTRKIKTAGDLLDITLLDHIILTKDGHFSFAEEGLAGIEQTYTFEPEENIIMSPAANGTELMEKRAIELRQRLLKL